MGTIFDLSWRVVYLFKINYDSIKPNRDFI